MTYITAVDQHALELLDASFDRTLISFGLAKTLNGIVSLLQGTQLTLTPAGVGVNLSIGEILDPFNDMVERFSWVMLFATISLGVQKVLLVLSGKIFVKIVIALVSLWSIFILWSTNSKLAKTLDIERKFKALQHTIYSAYTNIIDLITVFVIQTVLLPLLFLWLLVTLLVFCFI